MDSLGTRPLLYTGSEETPVERAWSLEQMRPSILKEYEEIGVHFIPNWDGNGGKIVNSYKLYDAYSRLEYVDYLMNQSCYSFLFAGSVEGFA